MMRSISFGLGLLALIVSTGYADAQLVRVHASVRSKDAAQKVCPELCAKNRSFGHRYEWTGQWGRNECHCAIKH